MTVANEADVTVALDTRLNRELQREGWARELVSRIQGLRKEQDLQVTDRIAVYYRLPTEADQAMSEFSDYVARETLAVELRESELAEVEPVMINDEPCRLKIEKCGDAR